MKDLYRGRYAPSPTGEMHLGNAWTALMAWLDARSHGGQFILRIENLDPNRSKPIYETQLIRDLRWLGLDWDEGPDVGGSYGPYRQSERFSLYQQALSQLRQDSRLYACQCTRAQLSVGAPHPGEQGRPYSGTCRELNLPLDGHALRVIVRSGVYSFEDGTRGRFKQDVSAVVGDFAVQRADGVPAYQLAVVVDDAAMAVTHVVRGDDLLDSTPRQLFLYEELQLQTPKFLHLPLLVDSEGRRLSKRQQDLSIAALHSAGVSPGQIVGYLAWKAHLQDTWRPVTPQELLSVFSIRLLPVEPIVVQESAHDFVSI